MDSIQVQPIRIRNGFTRNESNWEEMLTGVLALLDAVGISVDTGVC